MLKPALITSLNLPNKTWASRKIRSVFRPFLLILSLMPASTSPKCSKMPVREVWKVTKRLVHSIPLKSTRFSLPISHWTSKSFCKLLLCRRFKRPQASWSRFLESSVKPQTIRAVWLTSDYPSSATLSERTLHCAASLAIKRSMDSLILSARSAILEV